MIAARLTCDAKTGSVRRLDGDVLGGRYDAGGNSSTGFTLHGVVFAILRRRQSPGDWSRNPPGPGADGRPAAAPAPAGPAARSAVRRPGSGLSALQPRPGRGAGMQRHLCAGISAERHGDRAAYELLLAAGV